MYVFGICFGGINLLSSFVFRDVLTKAASRMWQIILIDTIYINFYDWKFTCFLIEVRNVPFGRLWQRPTEGFLESDAVWFCNVPVGEKKLRSFLSSLTKATNLSKVYTNHSVRATGASILSKCMYGPSQEMSVTGHKSVQS